MFNRNIVKGKIEIRGNKDKAWFTLFSSKYGSSELSQDDVKVISGLDELRGSAPTQLSISTGVPTKNIVGSIEKLDKIGLIQKDENEIKEFGKKLAFYKLTNEGYQVAHGFKLSK